MYPTGTITKARAPGWPKASGDPHVTDAMMAALRAVGAHPTKIAVETAEGFHASVATVLGVDRGLVACAESPLSADHAVQLAATALFATWQFERRQARERSTGR